MENKFSWHGPENDPSAVHLDILDAEVFITSKHDILNFGNLKFLSG